MLIIVIWCRSRWILNRTRWTGRCGIWIWMMIWSQGLRMRPWLQRARSWLLRQGLSRRGLRGKRSSHCPYGPDGAIYLDSQPLLQECIGPNGTYRIEINATSNFYLFDATETAGLLNSGVNLTLIDSEIRSNGTIRLFEQPESNRGRGGFKAPVNITIQNSKLMAQNSISLIPLRPRAGENSNIILNIEKQSELQAKTGELILLSRSRGKETDPGVSITIDGDSKITAKEGGPIRLVFSLGTANLNMSITDAQLHSGSEGLSLVGTTSGFGATKVTLSIKNGNFSANDRQLSLVASPGGSLQGTNLDATIDNSHLYVTNGNLTLVQGISGSSPSKMTLSMHNSTLTASGTPDGEQFLQVVPVGSVLSANSTLLLKNCRNNIVKVELTPEPGASGGLGYCPSGVAARLREF